MWGSALREQRLSAVFPVRGQLQEPDPYLHMLAEDVGVGIMPIGGRSQRSGFKVRLTPQDGEVEELVILGLGDKHGADALAASVCDFVQSCARWIMTFGEAAVEILTLRQKDGNEEVRCFDLAWVPPSSLLRVFGLVFQRVPRDARGEPSARRLIRIPKKRILTFRPPKDISPRALRSITGRLRPLSSIVPSFVREQLRGGDQTVHFDFARHARVSHLALAAITQPLGWNGRSILTDQMLEHYWLRREIRFLRFQAGLRASILETLNRGLQRIGESLGFNARIDVAGLPSVAEVDVAEKELEEGKRPFKDVFEALRIH